MLAKTQTTEHTIPISEILSLRLYADARPHLHHIANLQKGLILVYHGTELVGEGTGFGVPVARYQDKTYFPGSSTLRVFQEDDYTTVVKQYALNMIFQRRFREANIENKMMHKFTRLLDNLYLHHRRWRLLALTNLAKAIGVQTIFFQVKPRGNVTVTYHMEPQRVHLKANFELLEKNGLQQLFMLNEQGSRFFSRYFDSNSTVLFDKRIGAWEKVEADWACISNKSGDVGFRLWKVKDTILHRGREFLEGTLDWIGLDYEVSLDRPCLEYEIAIFGNGKQR